MPQKKKSDVSWQLIFNLANHLPGAVVTPGAAIVAGCVGGTRLGGVVASSWVGLTSFVPCVVTASIIMLQKPAISCFGLSLGVIGSQYAKLSFLLYLLLEDALEVLFSSQMDGDRDCWKTFTCAVDLAASLVHWDDVAS